MEMLIIFGVGLVVGGFGWDIVKRKFLRKKDAAPVVTPVSPVVPPSV